MERQKPRKEREADAKAAEEAEAARKAQAERDAAEAAAAGAEPAADASTPSRRAMRQQGPADAGAPVAAAGAAAEHDEIVEDTIIPEIVTSDDDAVDDVEPATRVQPVIEVVPLSEPLSPAAQAAADAEVADEGDDDVVEHIEILTVAETSEPTVVEEMVIDLPTAATVDPTAEAAAHADAEAREAAAASPTLAPLFQSPTERSRQLSSDELPSSFDDLLSLRNTAAANSISTTSALVLPNVPGSGDVGTALDETGEVIITGSIDLPASFGSMGAPASGLESTELDSFLEHSEVDTGSDVAPVSASRAISTNTSSTSLIAPPKRARANAPVVLAITAGVLAVGVVSLLLAVFVFHVF
ncbi:hypothetical protein VD659_17085 [Herbiconiux sp. 11R-BC]|uniref:hypothetical protein n=1 Tax=Herbiconiux sp. 11R-BC TaxID=3111637 RepID=UPI003BFD2DF1